MKTTKLFGAAAIALSSMSQGLSAIAGNGTDNGGDPTTYELSELALENYQYLKRVSIDWLFDAPNLVREKIDEAALSELGEELQNVQFEKRPPNEPNENGQCLMTDSQPNAIVYISPSLCIFPEGRREEFLSRMIYGEMVHHLGYGNGFATLAGNILYEVSRRGIPMEGFWKVILNDKTKESTTFEIVRNQGATYKDQKLILQRTLNKVLVSTRSYWIYPFADLKRVTVRTVVNLNEFNPFTGEFHAQAAVHATGVTMNEAVIVSGRVAKDGRSMKLRVTAKVISRWSNSDRAFFNGQQSQEFVAYKVIGQ